MYLHQYLKIDLTSGTTNTTVTEDTGRYIGGSGLGAYTLFTSAGPGHSDLDPLSEDNLLIFNTGPFTGTGIPSTGRHALVAKSPLTGIFAESDVGGRWGTMLKKTGYDGLIIKGRAEKPVTITISGSDVSISPASHLWGKDTRQTTDILQKKLGKKFQVACIGQAGEQCVPIAAVMHDGSDSRAAGRCGLGSVMGSKRLKAIAVYGSSKPECFDPEGLNQKKKKMTARVKKAAAQLGCYGTSGGITALEQSGDLPVKNFSQGRWPQSEKLSGEVMADTILTGRFACGACPVGCGRKIAVTSGKYSGMSGAGPEYETMGAFGSYCLVDDLQAVCMANDLCNRFGLDTISTGAAVAFAMEAFERGIISSADCGGLALAWGNGDAMVEMVRQIGEQRGLGKLLGRGVRSAAQMLGKGSAAFALHVKGLELPAHDPRAFVSTGLSYATSNRGACHLAGLSHAVEGGITIPEAGISRPMNRFTSAGKGPMVAKMQDIMGLFDAFKICKFLLYANITLTDLLCCLNLITGWDLTMEEMFETGERIFNIKRVYNINCGITAKDDRLPDRITSLSLDQGGTRGNLPDMKRMRKDYYAFRGWDENGIPEIRTLERLGIPVQHWSF
jgi:aldehyde:ferredoxin oxidoreductase